MIYGLKKGEEIQEAFVKTNDPNIVDYYHVVKEEIYLDKLQDEIDRIQNQIDNSPKHVEYPIGVSKEVKDAIDEHNSRVVSVEDMEKYKEKLKKLKEKADKAEKKEKI